MPRSPSSSATLGGGFTVDHDSQSLRAGSRSPGRTVSQLTIPKSVRIPLFDRETAPSGSLNEQERPPDYAPTNDCPSDMDAERARARLYQLYPVVWSCPFRYLYFSLFKKNTLKRWFLAAQYDTDAEFEKNCPTRADRLLLTTAEGKIRSQLYLPYSVLSEWVRSDGSVAALIAIAGILGSREVFWDGKGLA